MTTQPRLAARFSLYFIATIGLSVGFVGIAPDVTAQEWTQFRGPNAQGIAEDSPSIPVSYTAADTNWRVELAGQGHSSPVVWGDRLFVPSYDSRSRTWFLQCLNTSDGAERWRATYSFAPYAIHEFSSFASASPAVDEHHVYINWATPQKYVLAAFDHDGNKVWENDLGSFASAHGSGVSPKVVGDMLILNHDQTPPVRSAVLAFDRMTGRRLWRTERDSAQISYVSPTEYEVNGRTQLLTTSQAAGVVSYDAATGRQLWSVPGAWDKRSLYSPQLAGGLIFASCGSGGGGNYMLAIRPPSEPGGRAEIAYRIDRGAPYVPAPLAYRDRLFLVADGGVVTCLIPETGEIVWQSRIRDDFFGSPIGINGLVYVMSRGGYLHVFRAGDEFDLLASVDLGEESHSTPAVSGGKMYLRTVEHLISIGGDVVSSR